MGKFIFPETGKTGNGKISFFPDREKSGTGERNFSRNGNGKDHFPVPVPVHAYREREKEFFPERERERPFSRSRPCLYRGNPNGTSCFPVRRTGTLLVSYKLLWVRALILTWCITTEIVI